MANTCSYVGIHVGKSMSIRRSIPLIVCLTLGQVAFAQHSVTKTTVCEVIAHPERFDNKFVELHAIVVSGFEVFAITDPEDKCGRLWLAYPVGGPVAMTSFGNATPELRRSAVTLKKDSNLSDFQDKLSAQMYPKQRGSLCIACGRYEVSGVFVGRVDYAGPNGGFGHMNGYKQQFVLQSVSHVIAKDLASKYDANKFSTEPVQFPVGFITGDVIGPDGKPIPLVEVDAISAVEVPLYLEPNPARSDALGHFKLEVSPGQYVVGVNLKNSPSLKAPFPPTYYPQTTSREDAKVFEISDRQSIDIMLKLDQVLRPIAIPVHVSWPDGTPAEVANVWLSEQTSPRKVVGRAVSHTDADGNFSLTGFQGIRYFVYANIYKKPGFIPFCAKKQETEGPVNEPLLFVLTITGDVCRRPD